MADSIDTNQPARVKPYIDPSFGGIAERSRLINKKRMVYGSSIFTIPATTNNYYLDTSGNDNNGRTSNIDLGKLCGAQGRNFVFEPYLYSVIISAGINPNTAAAITLGGASIYLNDSVDNEPLWSTTPPLQSANVYLAILGIDMPLPTWRFDDYENRSIRLIRLQNIQLNFACVISNGTVAPLIVTIYTRLHYHIEELGDVEV